jgi:hypothetical protein
MVDTPTRMLRPYEFRLTETEIQLGLNKSCIYNG